jgi:hypothetical protein
MKHLTTIQTEFLKEARKWDKLSLEEQREYLKKHPGSKRKLNAKSKDNEIHSLRDDISNNLKKLPFISHSFHTTNVLNEPTVVAIGRTEKNKLSTQIVVNMSSKHLEFNKISVHPKDQGKGHSIAMVKAVYDAVLDHNKFHNIPVYIDMPNEPYWNKIKKKLPLLNWRN